MPQIGETVIGRAIHYVPGGKGANQAVGCARLGARTAMLGAVGSDPFGKRMLEEMRRHGVDTSEIVTVEGPTGTATILHTPEDNCIVVVPGANGAFTPDKLAAAERHLRAARVMAVQLEIPLETVEYALTIARAAGVAAILNPAPAVRLPRELLSSADYMTPNESEFRMLCGRAFSTDRELAVLLADWERTHRHKVIVTRGARGCSYLNKSGELVTVSPPQVRVVDTTGAGDAFNAAFAYALYRAWPLEKAVPFAVRAGALAVTRFGAQAGMPTLPEVLAGIAPSSSGAGGEGTEG